MAQLFRWATGDVNRGNVADVFDHKASGFNQELFIQK
jgi:hypothetical protein